MKKEFNLSEKVFMIHLADNFLINLKDVQEFIKLLKEEFKHETYWQNVCDKIDKLAGEELKWDGYRQE